jgi:hypothetical protein
MKAVVINLETTEYKFRSNKGAKVLNALMTCLKLAAKYNQINYQNEDMNCEIFVDTVDSVSVRYTSDRQDVCATKVLYLIFVPHILGICCKS